MEFRNERSDKCWWTSAEVDMCLAKFLIMFLAPLERANMVAGTEVSCSSSMPRSLLVKGFAGGCLSTRRPTLGIRGGAHRPFGRCTHWRFGYQSSSMCSEPPSGRESDCQCVSWPAGRVVFERIGQQSLVDLLDLVLAKVDHCIGW